MTFSTTPRSRSPVLSIYTQSEDAEALRAEIEAASTQQQRFKRHKTRHWVEPTIEEESDLEEEDHGRDCTKCRRLRHAQEHHTYRPGRRSFSTSLQGITGTVRGELSSAKRFLKDTSLRQLHRMRPRSNSIVKPVADRTTYSEDVDLDTTCNSSSQPAELSSDPLYQLEDNQRTSIQSDDYRLQLPAFPDFQKFMPMDNLSFDHQNYGSRDLSSKSLPCDNCQQLIQGKDHYDFCALCRPINRVLCMTCARQKKCSRHESESFNPDELSSARSSPAPPSYCSPRRESGPENGIDARLNCGEARASHQVIDPENPSQQDEGAIDECETNTSDVKVDRMDRISDECNSMLQALKNIANQQEPSSIDQRERMLQDREVKLREQFAAVREERAAVKEQELLVREREHLSRERDALVIRNLQTLVTFQELSRNGFIGSQFNSFKKNDDLRPQQGKDSLSRSKSHTSHDGISLDDLPQEHQPDSSIANVVAQAEATINDFVLPDKHVRSNPGQKRKKEGQTAMSGSISPANAQNTAQSKPSNQHRQQAPDEDDEDNEEESNPPKKHKQNSSEPDSPQRIYACPYFKHDRMRYSPRNVTEKHYRGCAGHFLHDIPRLKQHLRRVHWRPDHHCPRCFEEFSTPGELQEHFEQADFCSKKECPFPEKMDKAQRRQIHVKRPKVPPETLWYDIYKVLFPGSPLPDSPYAEEDEITPPSSATPSCASPEEAAQRMLQIFNSRLDRHKTRPGHHFLSSSEFRQLLDAEIAGSMSELFSTLSVEPSTPQGKPHSQPPSIMVSPVTPPSASPSAKNPSKLKTSALPSKPSASTRSRQVYHAAPKLKEPKPRRATALDRNMSGLTSVAPMAHIALMPVVEAPSLADNCSIDLQAMEFAMANFPPTEPVDDGYDDQSHSYQQGDDKGLMATINDSSGTGLNHAGAPRSMGPGKDNNFVPVRLSALEEPTIDQMTGTQQLQPNKSMASLVDSGYGSGNSEHSRPRLAVFDEETDVSDDISPVGHTTFEESLQLLQSSGEFPDPWQLDFDPASFKF